MGSFNKVQKFHGKVGKTNLPEHSKQYQVTSLLAQWDFYQGPYIDISLTLSTLIYKEEEGVKDTFLDYGTP